MAGNLFIFKIFTVQTVKHWPAKCHHRHITCLRGRSDDHFHPVILMNLNDLLFNLEFETKSFNHSNEYK